MVVDVFDAEDDLFLFYSKVYFMIQQDFSVNSKKFKNLKKN